MALLPNHVDEYASQLSKSLQGALKTGRWSKIILPELLELIKFTNQTTVSHEYRCSLHLLAGLYAFYSDNRNHAKVEFISAKRLGVVNPTSVSPDIWTPEALDFFTKLPAKKTVPAAKRSA